MSNVVEFLFLLGFFAPPLAVFAGALLLLVPRSDRRQGIASVHATPAHR